MDEIYTISRILSIANASYMKPLQVFQDLMLHIPYNGCFHMPYNGTGHWRTWIRFCKNMWLPKGGVIDF